MVRRASNYVPVHNDASKAQYPHALCSNLHSACIGLLTIVMSGRVREQPLRDICFYGVVGIAFADVTTHGRCQVFEPQNRLNLRDAGLTQLRHRQVQTQIAAKFVLLLSGLSHKIGRLTLSCCGVAAATLLLLVLFGTLRGIDRSVVSYVGQPAIDLWAAPRGSDNFVRSSGLLSPEQVSLLMRAEGLAQAGPVLRAFITVSRVNAGPEPPLHLLAIGFQAPTGLGGPVHLVDGQAPRAGQVTLDRVSAHRLGVHVGDSVQALKLRFVVSGITTDSNWISTQLLFCDYAELSHLLGVDGRASFVAMRVAANSSQGEAASKIAENFTDVEPIRRDEFVSLNLRETSAGLFPILVLLVTLGAFVVCLIVALLVQGLLEDRRCDIAVMLAMGISAESIAVSLMLQGARLATVGTVSAVALALVLERIVWHYFPVIQLWLTPRDAIFSTVLLNVASIIAAVAPMARLSKIDPMEAFRS